MDYCDFHTIAIVIVITITVQTSLGTTFIQAKPWCWGLIIGLSGLQNLLQQNTHLISLLSRLSQKTSKMFPKFPVLWVPEIPSATQTHSVEYFLKLHWQMHRHCSLGHESSPGSTHISRAAYCELKHVMIK